MMKKAIILIMCLFLVGCTSKEEKTVKTINDFTTVCSNVGLATADRMNMYKNDNYIKEAMQCVADNLEIEMVVYDNMESAKDVQEKQIENFNLLKSTNSISNKDKGKNYYRYEMVGNGYYMYSLQVDNTLIFTKTLLANKDKVTSVLEGLGY